MITIKSVIDTFCESRNVNKDSIFDGGYNPNLWYTRYMIWHYLHYNMGLSASRLADIFKRNRPSIFRGIRMIRQKMKINHKVRAEYNDIVEKIECE